MSDRRLLRFRMRLLIAAGLMLAHGPLIRAARAGGSTGGSGSDGSTGGTASEGSTTGGEAASTTGEAASTTGEGTSTTTVSSTTGDDSASTGVDGTAGPVTTANPSTTGDAGTGPGDGTSLGNDGFTGPDCTGCYGRPYVAEDRVRVASVIDTAAWLHPMGTPTLAEVDSSHRPALAAFWTTAALSEHSSVAGFHRFALDLLGHGAPPELVMRAQRAAIEELEHARACFGLASAYAGRAIGPGPMPLGTTAPIAFTLQELAVWTVHEGCVGETVAAWLASEIHEQAQDPAVRTVMAKIAKEEAEHAELAWATLRWAMAAGGEVVQRAVADAFASARVSPPVHGSLPCPTHGLLADATVDAAVRTAFSRLVQPCAERALAAA